MHRKPDPTLEAEICHYNYLKDLKSAGDQFTVKYLYDRLNIIDTKASSLLRFNGIIIGFLTVSVLRASDFAASIQPWLIYIVALIITIFLTASGALSLVIFYLKFDRVVGDTEEQKTASFNSYIKNFHAITISREKNFRIAFWLTAIGVGLFAASFIALTGYLLHPQIVLALNYLSIC